MKQKKIIAITPNTPSGNSVKSRSSAKSSRSSNSRTPGRESISHTVESYMRALIRRESKTGYACTVENLELALKNTKPDLLKRLRTLNVFYGEGDREVRQHIQNIFDTNQIYLSEDLNGSGKLIGSGGGTVLLMDFPKQSTGRDGLDCFGNIRNLLEEMLATRVGDNLIAPFKGLNVSKSDWFDKLLIEFSHAKTDAYKKAIAGIVVKQRHGLMSFLESTLTTDPDNEFCSALNELIENDTVSYRSDAARSRSFSSFESNDSHDYSNLVREGPLFPLSPESHHTFREDFGSGSPVVPFAELVDDHTEFVVVPATPPRHTSSQGPTSPIYELGKSPDVLRGKDRAITSRSNFSKLYARSLTPSPLSPVPACMAELSALPDGSIINISSTNAVLIQDLRKYDSVIEAIRSALADETSTTHPKTTGYALRFIETMWPDLLFADHINHHLMANRLTYSIEGTNEVSQGRFLDDKRCIDKYKAFLCMTVAAFFAIDRSVEESASIMQQMRTSGTYDHAVEIMRCAYSLFDATDRSIIVGGSNYRALRAQSQVVLNATFGINISGRQ